MEDINKFIKEEKIINEIIENTIVLPVEYQNLLLMLSKGMAYIHSCSMEQSKEHKKNISLI